MGHQKEQSQSQSNAHAEMGEEKQVIESKREKQFLNHGLYKS
jgi:hypothetical protein